MSAGTITPEVSLSRSIELTTINTIRTLAMDAVQAANSGHPGTPMAMAPVAYCMPSWELFDDQPGDYRDSVLPPHVKARVSVEEASDFGWSKYTGTGGANIGIETFGASAPIKQLLKKFGFTADHIATVAKNQILRH